MVFAFVASVSFLLVNVVDPFSGATASPDFAAQGERFGGADVQAFDVDGEYTIDVSKEGYVVEKKPEPKVAAASTLGRQRMGTARGDARSGLGAGVCRGSGRRAGLAVERVRLPRRPLEQGVRLASERVQRLERRLRHPAGPARHRRWPPQAPTGRRTPRPRSTWGLGYVQGRYGTPCGAWAHSQDVGWY